MKVINGEPEQGSLRHRQPFMLVIVCLFLMCASLPAKAEQAPLLAAASSLRSLWPDLIAHYQKKFPEPAPKASFASSGLLSTQILNGAPFELFLSADAKSIAQLPAPLLGAEPQTFALGDLLLVAPRAGLLAKDLSMQALADAFTVTAHESDTANADLKLAIANPQHAPYGIAAREALMAASLWPLPSAQILLAENAAQTLQFVSTGAVAAALIPRSLLPAVTAELVSVAVPASTYSAVRHTVVLLSGATPAANTFYQWLISEDAHQPLKAAGLTIPSP